MVSSVRVSMKHLGDGRVGANRVQPANSKGGNWWQSPLCASELTRLGGMRRHECRRGRHECLRHVAGGQVIIDGAAEAFFEPGAGAPAEGALGTGDIETAARLAVGLCGVPDDATAETGEGGDLVDQIAEEDFPAAAQVDGIGPIIPFGGSHDGFGAIFDVEELAAGRTIAPTDDFAAVLLHGLDAFTDQRGYDVG